ncbi:hypothetical protein [Sphingomonas sp. UYP23]
MMIPIRLFPVCSVLAIGLGAAAPVPVPDSVYTVRDDGVVAASVDRAPGTLRIDPGAPALPILTKPFALTAGLKPGMFGLQYKVGPSAVRGVTAVTHLTVDGMPVRRRVGWFDTPYAAGPDGVIGPGGLPAPVVRFELHPPRLGERTLDLPLVDGGALIGNWGGLFGEIIVGGVPMRVRFDLHHRLSLASAGAAQRIAAAQGGALTGPIDQAEIAFGIARPVRRMTLATPFAIGPLALNELHVRVADYGNTATIRDADVPPIPTRSS